MLVSSIWFGSVDVVPKTHCCRYFFIKNDCALRWASAHVRIGTGPAFVDGGGGGRGDTSCRIVSSGLVRYNSRFNRFLLNRRGAPCTGERTTPVWGRSTSTRGAVPATAHTPGSGATRSTIARGTSDTWRWVFIRCCCCCCCCVVVSVLPLRRGNVLKGERSMPFVLLRFRECRWAISGRKSGNFCLEMGGVSYVTYVCL